MTKAQVGVGVFGSECYARYEGTSLLAWNRDWTGVCRPFSPPSHLTQHFSLYTCPTPPSDWLSSVQILTALRHLCSEGAAMYWLPGTELFRMLDDCVRSLITSASSFWEICHSQVYRLGQEKEPSPDLRPQAPLIVNASFYLAVYTI